MDRSATYQLSELELIVLSAYLLALPLPPLLSGNSTNQNAKGEVALKEATQSLLSKGLIQEKPTNHHQGVVIHNLAQALQTIAYGNQMVHLFIQHHSLPSRRVAFYHNQGEYVQQELLEGGQHRIQPAQDLGLSLVSEILHEAPEGERGINTQLPLQAWHLLLSSREAGNQDEVLSKIFSSDHRSDRDGPDHRKILVKDILNAHTILELTSIYNRLNHQQEKAAFIILDNTNWLAMVTNYKNGLDEKIYAIQVPKQNLLWAAESIFASIRTSMQLTGRSA